MLIDFVFTCIGGCQPFGDVTSAKDKYFDHDFFQDQHSSCLHLCLSELSDVLPEIVHLT